MHSSRHTRIYLLADTHTQVKFVSVCVCVCDPVCVCVCALSLLCMCVCVCLFFLLVCIVNVQSKVHIQLQTKNLLENAERVAELSSQHTCDMQRHRRRLHLCAAELFALAA